MSKSLGSVATLEESPDGSSWVTMGKVVKFDLGAKSNAIDSTDNDDAGYKSKLVGDQMASPTIEVNWDPSNAGQVAVLNNFASKTNTYFRYRARGAGTGLPQVVVQLVLTEGYPPSEHEKLQVFTIKGESTGAVTQSYQ